MIDILMATYNGDKYLDSQILSLIGQSYKDWKLYIHDDGSIDNTLAIVEKYRQVDNRIVLVEDGIRFGNAGLNFVHLMQFSSANYIMFCDQDDIWLESKLENLLSQIKEERGPVAVYCNAYGYNGEEIIVNKVSLIERDNLSNSLFLNSGVQGCSLMFNRVLLDMALDLPDYIYMHDHYITMMAVTFGKLKYIDKSLMLYRQHLNNVTGNVPTSVIQRLKIFISGSPIIDKKHYNANLSIYNKFKHNLSDEDKDLFRAYIEFPNVHIMKRIRSIFKYNFRIGKSKTILVLKLFIKRVIN